jgi:ketosteroid isomerase-like protein
MTKSWRIAALALLVAAPLLADGDAAAEIRAADQRRFAAMVDADVAVLGELVGEDLTYVHSSGHRESRAQFLETIATGGLRYQSIEPAKVEVRVFGEAAVVNGEAVVRVVSKGKDLLLEVLFTEAWAKRAGRWQLVAWQSTRRGAG